MTIRLRSTPQVGDLDGNASWIGAGSASWNVALLHAAPVLLLILGLFYYWFAVADRYTVFLYEHLGATPFDDVTSSRYWMAGLVACGAVMVAYTSANWLLGRIAVLRQSEYRPPTWWRVWLFCATPLVVGIAIITMTVNWPTLPLPSAVACVVATLVGLAFALAPASLAAQRPAGLVWIALDGLGLMPSLLLLRVVELPGRGLAVNAGTAYLAAVGSVLAGVVWLAITTFLRFRRRQLQTGAGALLVAGLCLSYLLMPLMHYLTTSWHYISASTNFFAFSLPVQLGVIVVAAALAIGITRVRRYVQARYQS